MAKGIMIIVEQRNLQIRKVSLELLSQARKIADATGEPVVAVVLGQGIDELAATVAASGADKVILIDDAKLAEYTTGAYTSVLNKLIRKEEPQAVLIGNTAVGKDLAPRLAQRLGVGLASDCTGMEADSNSFLTFKRPIYAGKAFAHLTSNVRPIMATIRPNTFPVAAPDAARQAEVVKEAAEIDAADLVAILKEVAIAASKRPELTEANIIVSGGRGMKGPENYNILEDLADVVGAAVGASRAAVDSGWKEHKFQVGQTGKTVAPTLYIACGISGAIQHLAGMGSSKFIVAINKDPEANIFNVADYGIVGDLFEVVPLLTQEFKKLVNE
ncbi:electron transfer flavoprotein subunit alpha/FixB family protein [Desulfosporosinus sp.]|uniref:electron transfer flavoprotein subunit alpha/FixB family protein n=1 Tax=Desulfosporosinus sp. TaxID=157907 RepID=UPI00230FE7A7|nr:electron transfer flavoprotein subunit alpha/FixB family protein [Desulfosporosinus sp.]MCO5386638.1 electron transfer flavoprotein subunit alpha/FixB family protein [Desulfosporosinus sp.]MDA8222687.1 electron transfer flavoprotein subunit alpha/FixB family protein [Desulfitobacterium hafniense]